MIIENVLNLPFDQYQRYRIVSDIINKYRKPGQTFRILEVGASYGCNLKKFLSTDTIYFMDIDYPDEYRNVEYYLVGDFTKIKFTESYDFIVSIDTYEHIPTVDREIFIDRLIEGSIIASILAAPFDTRMFMNTRSSLMRYTMSITVMSTPGLKST